jgi:hypothetical protein
VSGSQRRLAEQGGEMVLPGQDLHLEIGDRRGGGHRMAPERAQPLHVELHGRIAGQEAQRLEDVGAAHLLEAPEQIAGVIQHDPRVAALRDQLRQQVGHPPVAVGEGLGVVVVALARVLEHPLQMADQLPPGPRRDRGLVHVQRAGEG